MIVNTRLPPTRLLFHTDFEPVLEQNDAGIDHRPLDQWRVFQEYPRLFFRAEPHDAFYPGAVVPAAIEQDDFASCGKVRQVSLHIHLGFFAVRRCRQGDDVKYARTHAFGTRLDCPALASTVSSLE